MYTQCPNCNTVFRISAQQLKAASGRVRCGHCSHVFNALEKLLEHLPPGYSPGTPPPPRKPTAPRADTPATPPRAAPSAGTGNPPPARPPASQAPPATPVSKPDRVQTTKPTVKPAPAPASAKSAPPASAPATPLGKTDATQPTTPAPKAPASGSAETAPTTPRPWTPEKAKKPAPATPPRRRVSDESKRSEAPSFKDIKLPGGPIGMDSVDWSIPDEDDTPPDLDLSAADVSKQPPGKDTPAAMDDSELEDIDAFLKELAADVEAVGAELHDAETEPSPAETLVLVDEVPPTPREEKTPEAPPEGARHTAPAPSPTTDAQAGGHERPAASFDPLATIEQAPVVEAPEIDGAVPPSLRASLAAAEEKPRGPLATLLGVVLILILLAGLAAQAAYFRGGEVAAQVPAMRPWLERFCDVARCTIPARRDLSKLALVSRDVRSDPKAKGALLVTATIVNNANFTQPYPDLLVTLYDLTGTAVAQRQFKPSEYLAHTPQALAQYRAGHGMPTDTPVNIELEVVDPGKQAINYEFDFR